MHLIVSAVCALGAAGATNNAAYARHAAVTPTPAARRRRLHSQASMNRTIPKTRALFVGIVKSNLQFETRNLPRRGRRLLCLGSCNFSQLLVREGCRWAFSALRRLSTAGWRRRQRHNATLLSLASGPPLPPKSVECRCSVSALRLLLSSCSAPKTFSRSRLAY